MSKIKRGLLPALLVGFIFAFFVPNNHTQAASVRTLLSTNPANINKIKTQSYDVKMVTYTDAQGNTQLAMIDCSGVSGVPGISGLCNALDLGLDSISTSIAGIGTSVMSSFVSGFVDFFWNTMVPTVLYKGTDFLFKGINPVPSTTSDAQPPPAKAPYPLALVNWVYQNPPNLGTLASLNTILANNILGEKMTLAATPGRTRLNPIFNIWSVMRSLAFLLIVLVLVAYGIMVMLRYHIDPRTVATVQMAIPRLALALIAITFSYTIASFAIDIAQVMLSVVFDIFRNLPNMPPCNVSACVPWTSDPLRLQSLFGTILQINLPDFGNPLANWLAGFLVNFAIWYLFFNLFFTLITRYATIFVLAILGPLALAVGIVPGKSDAIIKWVSNLLVCALTFPGIYFFLNLAVYINQIGQTITLPDPINSSAGPINGLIVIGILVLATRVPAYLEEALDVVPSGHTARAGVDIGQAARRAPFIGGFLG